MTDEQHEYGIAPRHHRWGRRLKRGLLLTGMMVFIVALALGIAHRGVSHPEETAALREWMRETRYGWLSWRLMLYSLLAWRCRKIWQAPGCRPAYRPLLKRMALVTLVFILACEYSLSVGGTAP